MDTTKTNFTMKVIRTSVRRTTASSQQLERHAQQAVHNAQQVHQWRRWLRRLRGAHRALSLHIERTVPHLMMTPHGSCSEQSHCHQHVIHGAFFLTRSLPSSLLVLPALLRLLPLSRAVPWARQPDRHCKSALLRLRWEWGHTELLHFSHRLWAQPPDFRRAQWLISPLLLHDPFHGPRRGWRDTRLDAHSGTPRTSRILRTRRLVSQSVSRRLKFSMDQGNLMQTEWSITQEHLVLPETRTVLTACILKTSKLREWSINQGNLMSETAQTHRLGLYLKSKDRRLSRNISKKSVITKSMQLTQKKSAGSYKDNYVDRNWNFVKLINNVLQRWKNYENSKFLPSIRSQDERAHRRPEHYYGIIRKITGTAK